MPEDIEEKNKNQKELNVEGFKKPASKERPFQFASSKTKGSRPEGARHASFEAARPEGRGSLPEGAALNETEQQLEECRKLKDEYLASWQRSRADLINYKKEEMIRVGEFVKYADIGLVLKILPILDNFELVKKKLPENLKKDENVKGLLQIKNQLQDFLKNQGAEEIKCLGEKFDPQLHEVVEEVALSEVSAKEGKKIESGIIVEETQKGYKIKGRMLRPAKVKVVK